jgi:hypothetical protein
MAEERDRVRIEIDTQPIPEYVAEACAWLSAAERCREPRLPSHLRDRATAAEALNILLDVNPPYPPIDTAKPAAPLAQAAPQAISALELAMRGDGLPGDQLRLGRALRHLRQSLR